MANQGNELVLVNGVIYTMNADTPWAQALAVRDGRLVAVGSEEVARAAVGSGAKVLDLQGKMVMPGMIDVHSHFVLAGRAELYDVNFLPTASLDQIIEQVREAAKDRPLDRWIVGGIWGSTLLEELTYEARLRLDDASGGRPVMLRDDSHHNRWLNLAGLKACGIDNSTPDPINGTIVRHPQTGEATGLLLETASALAEAAVSKSLAAEPELDVAAAVHAVKRMNAMGVTGLQDALTARMMMEAIKTAADRGQLTAWVVGSMPALEGGPLAAEQWGKELFELRDQYRSQYFRPDFGKIFLDGVPTTRTASMLEPYLPDTLHGCCFRGATFLTVPQLARVIAECEEADVSLKIHCTGDGSVRVALDAFEVVRTFNGGNRMHQIAHAGYLHDDDIARFKELNIVADLSPMIWCPGVIVDQLNSVLPPERVTRSYPNRSMDEAGVLLAVGSDWPVVPDPSPWISLQAIITRRDPSGAFPGEMWPEQGLDLATALRAYTIGPATAMGLSQETGSLENGKSADFIVLDRHLFQIPLDQLAKTQVLQTYFAGSLVYEAQV
ncbi:amidohydrolase [Pseudomonas citri]|uniref:amidohydrolase n=1 Tax=Pseudomonas citri TaxID=2978349 RepID=UPI0021B515FB|nr:amidohydrolase [Pseudomonas citri]